MFIFFNGLSIYCTSKNNDHILLIKNFDGFDIYVVKYNVIILTAHIFFK